jgi:hypothetical protein
VSAPYLEPCLATLRAEFNALNPKRDKGSDGWIGDEAHQAEHSDHNPDSAGRVLALDIDATGPWPGGVTDFNAFNMMVESLRGDSRLEYIIWNRRIASRDQGWKWRTYTGTSDPHTGHAHFSARHDHTGNTSTADWGIEIMAVADDVAELLKLLHYDQKVLSNIQVAINNLPDTTAAAVVAAIADPDDPDDSVAAALRAVLGDRAAAVGRLLAA